MINIDADGFLVDWQGYVIENHLPYMTIEELNGLPSHERKRILRRIYEEDPQLFYKLEPLEGATEFMQKIMSLGEPWRILTSAGTDHPDFNMAKESKIQNLKKHFGISSEYITVCESSEAKARYVENNGDILADDYLRNVLQWVENGGIGIHLNKPNAHDLVFTRICETIGYGIPEDAF